MLDRFKCEEEKWVEYEDKKWQGTGDEEDFFDKQIFDQKPERNEGVRHAEIWENNIPGKEKNKCKGPEVGAYFECSRKSKKANAAGTWKWGERIKRSWSAHFISTYTKIGPSRED